MAVIVVVPVVKEVAKPLEPGALLMDATVETSGVVFQVTNDVRSCVVRSVNNPVAINCCFVPRAMLGLTGVTAMDNSVAGVTASVAGIADIIPVLGSVAVIVVVPTVNEVAKPLEPATLLMDATVETSGTVFQVTDDVRSCGGPAVNIPVALNCCFIPRATLALIGVIAMDTKVTGVTVSVVVPDVSESVIGSA